MSSIIKVAVLGCGMMGQEHISYMEKYDKIKIKFLCDPNEQSKQKAVSLISSESKPMLFSNENELFEHIHDIDLLVIATPNYMHTPQLLRWGQYDICILVEKPVAISEKQVLALRLKSPTFKAHIWVAMEYRYMPAVQKLYQLLPQIGTVQNITIRENRFPFLSKVGEWNKDVQKSGDTLVEKCVHFFDLFRLLSGQEIKSCTAKVQRGVLYDHYEYDQQDHDTVPIIDSAYVLMDFTANSTHAQHHSDKASSNHRKHFQLDVMGCLELCMFADGARHQEEIIVTGTKGRLEAYMPENKVFFFLRPKAELWVERSQPPPKSIIHREIIDCSDLSRVYDFAHEIPQHAGHHYCSTAVEWKFLIDQVVNWQNGKPFVPQVSLHDGLSAVAMGMIAQKNVTSKAEGMTTITTEPIIAFSTQSCEHLLNLAISACNVSSPTRTHPSMEILKEYNRDEDLSRAEEEKILYNNDEDDYSEEEKVSRESILI